MTGRLNHVKTTTDKAAIFDLFTTQIELRPCLSLYNASTQFIPKLFYLSALGIDN